MSLNPISLPRSESHIKQGFAWWSFQEAPSQAPDLLRAAADIGYSGVDFLETQHWKRAKDLGLELTIIDGHERIEVGFNDYRNHAVLQDEVRRNIDIASRNEVRSLSVASGDWSGPPHDGIKICVEGLAPLAIDAEAAGITLLIEPLNSKIDHVGHECDSTQWAMAVVQEVGSAALRVLYDLYHMQIMEGDLLRTMTSCFDRIGHIHTAGVPGRAELDNHQEINWPCISSYLHATQYKGYVTHEFIPRGDPVKALKEAFDIFDRPGEK